MKINGVFAVTLCYTLANFCR